MNDHRMPIINHLVDDLHKRLNELENLYSTVNKHVFFFLLVFVSLLLRLYEVQIREIRC